MSEAGGPGHNKESTNRAELARQAASCAHSEVLSRPELIQPVLEMAAIDPDDRVLDVGCGTGFLLTAVAGHAGQVIGVDLTPAMLAEARRRCDGLGLPNVTLREANAEALPFAEERFDVVLTRVTLHHCPNPRRILAEIFRVCRSGGRVVVCDIASSGEPARADLHNRMERLRDPSHVEYYPEGALVDMVEEAGFQVTATKRWETRRRFGEWTELAAVRPEVKPALECLLRSFIPDDVAGIQPALEEDGELTFTHAFLVIGCKKPCGANSNAVKGSI